MLHEADARLGPSQIAGELMSTVGEAVAPATRIEPQMVAWDPAWERFVIR